MFRFIRNYFILRKAKKMADTNEIVMSLIFAVAKIQKIDPVKLLEVIDEKLDLMNSSDKKKIESSFIHKFTVASGERTLKKMKEMKRDSDIAFIKDRQAQLNDM